MAEAKGKTVTPEASQEAAQTEMPTESKMKRFRVGDVVAYEDVSEWPPIHMEGPIKEFTNVEGTYLLVDLSDPDGKTEEKELTEDDVTRVG